MKNEKVLVLCIDRDDDIGVKTGWDTPVFGRENNLELAQNLGVSDPTESDVNAIYQAVNLYDELKKDNDVELLTIAGDSSSELKADQKISEELDKALEEVKADKAVLVTDGAEDDRVIPIVESQIKLLSVNQAIVKQSKQLESSYFMIKDFFKNVSENRETSRILFGIPAMALLIYALFGAAGWRLILGSIGVYLFVKGFSLEGSVKSIYEELRTSLTSKRTSFFLYILAIVVLIAGFGRSYNFIIFSGYESIFNQISAFFYTSIFFMYGSGALTGLGKIIKTPERDLGLLYLLYMGIGLAVSLLVYETAAYLILIESNLTTLLSTALVSSLIAGVTLFIERKLR